MDAYPLRPDLRVVVCGRSTLLYDEKAVNAFFPGAVHLWFRSYLGVCLPESLPEPMADYVAEAVRTVRRIYSAEPPGDVLVFLPSCADIQAAERLLAAAATPGAASSHAASTTASPPI